MQFCFTLFVVYFSFQLYHIYFMFQPYKHCQKIAIYCYADSNLINKAIENSLAARREWEARPLSDRAQIFFKAADILSERDRGKILAATMAGQVIFLRMFVMILVGVDRRHPIIVVKR